MIRNLDLMYLLNILSTDKFKFPVNFSTLSVDRLES